jgi:hypothetical protein
MKGFRTATGDLFAWLNSDDYYLPHALETIAAAYRSASGGPPSLIYSNCYVKQFIPTLEASAAPGTFPPELYRAWQPGEVSDETYRDRCPLPQQSTFFAAQAFRDVGGLDISLHYAMDYELWIKLITAGYGSLYVNTFTSVFRLHDTSKSMSTAVGFSCDTLRFMCRHYGIESMQASAMKLCTDIIKEKGASRVEDIVSICHSLLSGVGEREVMDFLSSNQFNTVASRALAEAAWRKILHDYSAGDYTARISDIIRYLSFFPNSQLTWYRVQLVLKSFLPIPLREYFKGNRGVSNDSHG